MRLFAAPVVISLIAFGAVFLWGGSTALLLVLALSALEISLSFDNAVINAKTLAKMDIHWQRRFLTWGMVVAVFGIRFILPALIVAAAAVISPWAVIMLALQNPDEYARLLFAADPLIHAFGGSFLLMVALKYFFDEEKLVHWIFAIERRLAVWGRIAAIETFIAMVAVVAVSLVSHAPFPTLAAGLVGIVLYLVVEALTTLFTKEMRQEKRAGRIAAGGAALFVYLNVLDAAFSLDGVVGAFALTTQILIMLVGLGVGAYFVRTFTVYLTRRGTLTTFIYLEHGAHWAIFSLALCLFAALFTQVPEVVPGTVGLVFALLSFISSKRERRVLGL